MGKLDGMVALVTGSDSGIGQGCAVELAKDGADVVVTYHSDEDGAKETKESVEAEGRRAIVVHLDTTDESSVRDAFDAAIDAFDRVDVLVNSAGVDASGTNVKDLELADFEMSIRTNLFGPFLCCREFVRRRARSDGRPGRIINIGSIHEEVPRAGAADYDCGKGGLRNLTRTLALELAEEGVTVNNIAPGMVLTPFNQEAIDDPKVLAEQVKSIPMKRAAEPWELGRLAAFLASPDAAYVTGASYVIDGGLMQYQGQGA